MFKNSLVMTLVFAAVSAKPALADTLPLISGAPSTYTPGTPFSFEITVPQINGLSSFNVNLLFNATSQNLAASATPNSSSYVFTTTSGFTPNPALSSAGPGPTQISLEFGDSTSTPVNTTTGVNDVLGVVTVNPAANLTGPITVSFNVGTNVNYFSEGFDFPGGPVTIAQGSPPPASVPAPTGLVSLAIGAFVLAVWIRLNRRLERVGC